MSKKKLAEMVLGVTKKNALPMKVYVLPDGVAITGPGVRVPYEALREAYKSTFPGEKVPTMAGFCSALRGMTDGWDDPRNDLLMSFNGRADVRCVNVIPQAIVFYLETGKDPNVHGYE